MFKKRKENKFLYYGFGCFGCFGVLLMVVIIFGGCALLLSSDSDNAKTETKTNEVVVKKEVMDEKKEETKLHKSKATIDGVNYEVLSIDFSNSVAGYTSNEQYLIVKIQITNNSDSTITTNNSRFTLLIDNAEYEDDATTTAYLDGGFLLEKINPSISKIASIVYEVPSDVTKKEIHLQVKPNSFKKDVALIDIQ